MFPESEDPIVNLSVSWVLTNCMYRNCMDSVFLCHFEEKLQFVEWGSKTSIPTLGARYDLYTLTPLEIPPCTRICILIIQYLLHLFVTVEI